MNREERRHPEKKQKVNPKQQEKELYGADKPQDEASARAKSTRHKKMTADKWNQ